jgi:hypothetical protein
MTAYRIATAIFAAVVCLVLIDIARHAGTLHPYTALVGRAAVCLVLGWAVAGIWNHPDE